MAPFAAERIAHLQRAAEQDDATAPALHAYAFELLNCEVKSLREPEMALLMARRVVAMDNGKDAGALQTLALAYQKTGIIDKAIETQRRAIEIAKTGGLHDLAKMESKLLDYLLEQGDVGEAISISWNSLRANFGNWVFPGELPDTSLATQGEQLIEKRRFLEAAQVLGSCLAMRRKTLPKGHPSIGEALSLLGFAVAGERRFVEAEPLLLEGYSVLQGSEEAPFEHKRMAINRLIQLYEAWGKQNQAENWRKQLKEANINENSGG